jgi:hypothetical protein
MTKKIKNGKISGRICQEASREGARHGYHSAVKIDGTKNRSEINSRRPKRHFGHNKSRSFKTTFCIFSDIESASAFQA